MAKELILRASAVGAYVEVIVRADDTLTVTESGGSTTTFASNVANFQQSYSSPTILTVERHEVCATPACRGYVGRWKVSFSFGGSVEAWATSTYEASRQSHRRSENEPIWVWVNIPESLTSSTTGMCGVSGNCAFGPTLPYEWCEGDANCLPTATPDSLFSTARITALEAACGIANGASRRRPPSTCFNRPAREVDFGFVADSSGNTLRNPPQTGKWVKNLGITSGRHSGAYASYPTPTYTDLASYPNPGQDANYKSRAAYDGFCDPGATCGASSSDPIGSYTCICSNNNPGGCGGVVDDQDCPYDYTIRESSAAASTAEHQVSQECWDFCTGYINDGEQHCEARKILKNGGKIYCGYITGGTAYTIGRDAPAYNRCNVFISAGEMRTAGPWDGSDPQSRSNGPYLRYHLSAADGISTGSGLDGGCAPDEGDVCEGSTVTYDAAFTACSQSFSSSSDDHQACIMAICVEGCIECQISPDPDDPGPQVIGYYRPPAIPGLITTTSRFATAAEQWPASGSQQTTTFISLRTPTQIVFPVSDGESVLLLATVGPIRHRIGNRNTALRIIVDGTIVVAQTNTGNAYLYNHDSLSMHGVVSGLSAGDHTAEIQFTVRRIQPHTAPFGTHTH